MKKGIFTAIALLISAMFFLSYRSGPPTGATCAPGETSCASNNYCHKDTFPDTGPLFAELTMEGGVPPGNQYTPGQSYMIMPYIGDTDFMGKTYGFQCVAKLSDGSRAGMAMITDPGKTQLIYSADSNEYVSQTSSGATIMGVHDWMYDWTAPPPGSGKVVIYGAFLAANGDNTSSGDFVYTDSLVLYENTAAIPETKGKNADLIQLIFPNPAGDMLNIEIGNHVNKIEICDVHGQRVFFKDMKGNSSVQEIFRIDISRLNTGTYFMLISDEEGRKEIKKVFKIAGGI